MDRKILAAKIPHILAVVLALALLVGGFKYNTLSKELSLSREVLQTKEQKIAQMQEELNKINSDYDVLEDAYQTEKERNDAFARELKKATGIVMDLSKLSKIDPELLMKYSKVYFLSENYVPTRLTSIKSDYLTASARNSKFQGQAYDFLEDLMDAAKRSGNPLLIASAYRSFDQQATLKSGYQVVYGSGANAFSADQGYSEHQLGTAVDFTTAALSGGDLTGFEKTPQYEWLLKNAYKYGFVISYPQGNNYYMFEPWHWRFVGVKLATDLHDDNDYFYDLAQREIDKYLLGLFDH